MNGSETYYFLPGLLMAIVLHSFFNHFFFRPIAMTLGQLILLPLLVSFVFVRSERNLRDWLEIGLDTDVTILEYIKTGTLSETRIGKYLELMRKVLNFLSLGNAMPNRKKSKRQARTQEILK